MADTQHDTLLPRGPLRVWRALIWSLQGLRAAWRLESSFRLEVYVALVMTPIALTWGETPLEIAWLLGSLLLVLSAELFNSAIEALIDRHGTEYHELAGRAKDMGSAAVFVLMINVALSYGLLLGPRFLEWARSVG